MTQKNKGVVTLPIWPFWLVMLAAVLVMTW